MDKTKRRWGMQVLNKEHNPNNRFITTKLLSINDTDWSQSGNWPPFLNNPLLSLGKHKSKKKTPRNYFMSRYVKTSAMESPSLMSQSIYKNILPFNWPGHAKRRYICSKLSLDPDWLIGSYRSWSYCLLVSRQNILQFLGFKIRRSMVFKAVNGWSGCISPFVAVSFRYMILKPGRILHQSSF